MKCESPVMGRFHPEVILLDRAVSDIDGCPIVTALGSVLDCTQIRIISIKGSDAAKARHALLSSP